MFTLITSLSSSSRVRYFSTGESHVTNALEKVKANPSDVGAWICLAERARGKGRMEEARELLEEGLKSSQSSEVCVCVCVKSGQSSEVCIV